MKLKFGYCFAVALLGVNWAWAQLGTATPESQGIASEDILKWINVAERDIHVLHSFVLVRHGKIVASGWWDPYRETAPHRLFSHSKSFTATAVGLAIDERKLDLDEQVAEIFADKLPATIPDNLKQLRVRDLLTMNAGTKSDSFRNDPAGDWVKAFLASDFAVRPGTMFRYDSCATYMLAEIVEKKTGRKMMEYLKEKFFDPLGITGVETTYSPSGVPCGGWGMAMKTTDLARFGQCYLQEGAWNGKQVLSREWVRLATSKHTRNCGNASDYDNNDWHRGYGFQFWRCQHNCFRADGAGGQFTIMMPDQDAVFCATALFGDFQGAFNTVWEHLLPAMKNAPLPENPEALAKLREKCATLRLATVAGGREGVVKDLRSWKLKPNNGGFDELRFEPDEEGWKIVLSGDKRKVAFNVGHQKWRTGETSLTDATVDPLGAFGLLGTLNTAASGAWTENGKFTARVWYTHEAAKSKLELDFTGPKPKCLFHTDGACLPSTDLKLEAE
ncbi:MAG: serine hydrolase [Kiritimatiellae bacterium]|nr:serine hydrolase [Kiritimatiellia bacterium]